jgi:DNA-binding PadR family transcriptional regulator
MPLPQRTFFVLLALGGQPLYGYALRKKVLELSGGALELEPGGLYRLIGRLQDEGLVQAVPRPPSDRSADSRRQYYGLTPAGHETLREEAAHLTGLAGRPEVRAAAQGRG